MTSGLDFVRQSPRKRQWLALLTATLMAGGAQATDFRLEDAAGQAVQSNPEVLNKWHEFKAAVEERNVAWGRYLPTLDVVIGAGRSRGESPLYFPPGYRTYNFDASTVTLKQNLFEGFGTVNDTKRLEHATLVRFYEMLDTSENTAFDAAKAYIDVWRYRQLVSYAEDNYATHRVIYEKIKERAQAGVGKKVDLETAAGRLALAESNLTKENANLHDVTARYQRVVGSLPPAEMSAPPDSLLGQDFPKDRPGAVSTTLDRSPQLKAAFENILSAIRNVDVQKSRYYPRVDVYAEKDHEINTGGFPGPTNVNTIGITASWNLFDGLQDLSRERKAVQEKNSAKDVRERVCRSLRQDSSMAYNDHARLAEQLPYLDQHLLSTDKEREAFRHQYDIGQRTLLDVLDTENEYYTAKRDYLNAEDDLMVANAKYQAVSGHLLDVLNLKRLEMDPPHPSTTPEEDMLTTCPAEPAPVWVSDKEELFRRAWEKEHRAASELYVVMPEAGGKAGTVEVTTKDGKTETLHGDYSALSVEGKKQSTFVGDQALLDKNFNQSIKALPAPPHVVTLYFLTGKDELTPESKAESVKIFQDLVTGHANEVWVIGYTDTKGTDAMNDKLSQRRAEKIRQALIKRGVPAKDIVARGMGKHHLAVDTPDQTDEPKNRRVEIINRQ